ncbi:MAG: 30S ribosomal protein S15 [Candidatus Aenigmarchaeota archaeon CG_4_10_14_0_8_um_filter_37_24]|nr:30S ribosomal protein S15 [Candidatus Aenigmarchaeota archaeon]OIN88325.1 MAG: 30S ribosomal protein S15 [Candidatus Aenigmarchaeota archaeon CG1_02_38_14]PIV68160.1 MAG: 30S ribosomal protein S15 [Candidatus Aenigmarchaeota archaeon CG01_land_8_20_14_3_00_37_9]PIW40804.1 MAG: 30S ribosomal protein S15 [Candidatus Aenigmarchaeota archaeon CG15_BIG_FIL_POST_REV_8_21_14_020_37_27]PIX50287.1 MAG: 30S ribosomal protein S15 [Candidatus Aenigmarchaeota archaeon CG_4_8_14_3_um_filter_37_24]PIY3518
MARIHARKRGKSSSKRPVGKGSPRWVKYKKQEVEKLIVKYAKEDKSSSEIGMILRDQFGIPLTKRVTGKGMTKIMKENNVYPKFREDIFNLFKQAMNLREHLAKNKKDYTSKRGLELLESKIRRLGKYYVKKKILPENWKYEPEKVKLLIQQK